MMLPRYCRRLAGLSTGTAHFAKDHTTPGMNVTKHLSIRGRVQGVGYRDAMVREAKRRDVRGWVRNRRDGSVEAVASGAEADVAALIAWARRGPPAARVEEVLVTDLADAPANDRFEWRATL